LRTTAYLQTLPRERAKGSDPAAPRDRARDDHRRHRRHAAGARGRSPGPHQRRPAGLLVVSTLRGAAMPSVSAQRRARAPLLSSVARLSFATCPPSGGASRREVEAEAWGCTWPALRAAAAAAALAA